MTSQHTRSAAQTLHRVSKPHKMQNSYEALMDRLDGVAVLETADAQRKEVERIVKALVKLRESENSIPGVSSFAGD